MHVRRVGLEPLVLDHGGVVEGDLGGEVGEELGHADAAEVRSGEGDVVHVDRHERDVGHGGPADRAVVVEDGADADHGVRPVHHRVGRVRADLPPEDADELLVVFGEHALGGGLQGHGAAHGFRELQELLLGAGTPDLGSDEDHGLELAVEVLGGARGGGLESVLVAGDGVGHGADGTGPHASGSGKVGGNLNVTWLPGEDGGTEGTVNEAGCVDGAGNGHGAAGDLLGHLILIGVVWVAEGMMKDVILTGVVGVGGAADEDQGEILCVGTASAVEGREGTHAVSDNTG